MAEYTGFDTRLARGDGATPTEAFTDVAQVGESLDGPESSTDDIDVSHRDGDGHREFLPGMIDDGEVSFEAVFDPAVHMELIEAQQDREVGNWRLTFPDTTTCTFPGYVKTVGITSPMNDKLSADITLKVSGKPTWA